MAYEKQISLAALQSKMANLAEVFARDSANVATIHFRQQLGLDTELTKNCKPEELKPLETLACQFYDDYKQKMRDAYLKGAHDFSEVLVGSKKAQRLEYYKMPKFPIGQHVKRFSTEAMCEFEGKIICVFADFQMAIDSEFAYGNWLENQPDPPSELDQLYYGVKVMDGEDAFHWELAAESQLISWESSKHSPSPATV